MAREINRGNRRTWSPDHATDAPMPPTVSQSKSVGMLEWRKERSYWLVVRQSFHTWRSVVSNTSFQLQCRSPKLGAGAGARIKGA